MSDVYKIGVEIALNNTFSPTLSKLTQDLASVETAAKSVGGQFLSWDTALIGVSATIGVAVIGALKDAEEQAEKLVHVQQQIQAGYKDQALAAADVTRATSASYEIAMKHGQPVERVLADMKELRQVFGGMDEAIDFADKAEGLRTIGNAMLDGHGDKVREELYNTARIGELRGLSQNKKEMDALLEGMARVDEITGGKIGAKDLLQTVQYGRVAAQGWDDTFFSDYLPTLVQEMGPMQAGNALMTMYGSGVQGRVTKRALTQSEHYGLIGDKDKIIYDRWGDPRGAMPGWEIDTKGMMSSPFAWVQNDLNAQLNAHGITTGPGSLDALMAYSGLYGARTGAQVVAVMGLQGGRFEKDANLFRNAPGLAAEAGLLANDPVTVDNRFINAGHNLAVAAGEDMVKPVLAGKNFFSDVMDAGTKYLHDHPGFVIDMIKSTTLLGAPMYSWEKASSMWNKGVVHYDWKANDPPSPHDFTLGANGGFSKTPTYTNGGFGYVSNFSQMQLGPLAHQKMDEFTSALKEEGTKAETAAKEIADKIKEMLSFTAAPKINMPTVPPAGGPTGEKHAGNVYLDGRRVGKHVERSIAMNHSVPFGTNTHDSSAGWSPVDAVNVG